MYVCVCMCVCEYECMCLKKHILIKCISETHLARLDTYKDRRWRGGFFL